MKRIEFINEVKSIEKSKQFRACNMLAKKVKKQNYT